MILGQLGLPKAPDLLYVEPPTFGDFAASPHGIFLAPSQSWEVGNAQMDPFVRVWDGVAYLFYSAYDGAHVNIGVASCALGAYPAGLTKHAGNPIFSHGQQAGIDNWGVAAPAVFRMPDGSGRLYYHANPTGGVGDVACVATCTAAAFPLGPYTPYVDNPIIPVGAAGAWNAGYIHMQSIVPPAAVDPVNGSLDGFWHALCGCGDSTGNLWKTGHWISADGLEWYEDPRNPVFLPTGHAGDFDSYGTHAIGDVNVANGLYYLTYQGYDNVTWLAGLAVTRDFATFARCPRGSLWPLGAAGAPDHGSIEGPSIHWDRANHIAYLWSCAAASFGGDGVSGGSDYSIMLRSCATG